ncbi:hypothetical protein Noda2021_03720 [Candidatus Dependentiae bacterium Noda2021]|nr:hypothetical protein Noda2021_03720 [Candidatus Dependentiae bacterium Noda2021]
MRLGGYSALVDPQSVVAGIYKQYQEVEYDAAGNMIISERHRHRYEVNPEYVAILKDHGLTFSGYYTREDNTQLMEFIEISDHPFFVATQAHPEFKSRLENAHPLFTGFISACIEQSKMLSERVSSVVAIQASSQLAM